MAETGNVYVEKTKGRWMTTGDPKNYALASLAYNFMYEDFGEDIKKFIREI